MLLSINLKLISHTLTHLTHSHTLTHLVPLTSIPHMYHPPTHTHTSQAVELENTIPRNVTKYIVLITTTGHQDTEETLVLGTEQEESK